MTASPMHLRRSYVTIAAVVAACASVALPAAARAAQPAGITASTSPVHLQRDITINAYGNDFDQSGRALMYRTANEDGNFTAWKQYPASDSRLTATLSAGVGFKVVSVQLLFRNQQFSKIESLKTMVVPTAMTVGGGTNGNESFAAPPLSDIDAKGGQDVIRANGSLIKAGAGNDFVDTTSTLIDRYGRMGQEVAGVVDCGPGEDIVFATAMIGNAPDTKNCEHVYSRYYMQGRAYEKPAPDANVKSAKDGGDRINGTPQTELFLGGSGNDILLSGGQESKDGNEAIVGGAGDDVIDTGRSGPQNPAGATGFVWAGDGDDIIIVRQKSIEIDCGAGKDTIYLDSRVELGAAVTNCETIIPMGA